MHSAEATSSMSLGWPNLPHKSTVIYSDILCRSGGVQGGISNGENIVLRLAFKPTATISRNQKTVGRAGVDMELRAKGRHDPCVVPRAVPMVEAMVALVLADHLLQHFAQCELLPRQDSISPDTSIAGQFKRDSSALQEAAASH